MLSPDEIKTLEAQASENDGHCPTCHQTIKIYRYRLNPSHATFLRAMAKAIQGEGGNPGSGVNDVDVSALGLGYSVRTQVTKMRLHGLIARVKTPEGAQIPNRWLITKKGWGFLNGEAIPAKVVVYDNQTLGHDGGLETISTVLGEPQAERRVYDETPVSPAEARTYEDVRQPKRAMNVDAIYRGRTFKASIGDSFTLTVDRLALGQPVRTTVHIGGRIMTLKYPDIAAFQKEWRVL